MLSYKSSPASSSVQWRHSASPWRCRRCARAAVCVVLSARRETESRLSGVPSGSAGWRRYVCRLRGSAADTFTRARLRLSADALARAGAGTGIGIRQRQRTAYGCCAAPRCARGCRDARHGGRRQACCAGAALPEGAWLAAQTNPSHVHAASCAFPACRSPCARRVRHSGAARCNLLACGCRRAPRAASLTPRHCGLSPHAGR